jgi:hypothetical protein
MSHTIAIIELVSTHRWSRAAGSFMRTYFREPTPLLTRSPSPVPSDQVDSGAYEGLAHSEPMNDDGAEVFQGWTSDLEEDDAMEPLLDAKGDGSEDELIEAPHKRVRRQLDVPVLVARERARQLRLKELN